MELVRLFTALLSNSEHQDRRPVVEAVATWTENLRDAMSAASGLEQAIVATSSHAPSVLEAPIQRLIASLRYEPLEIGLRRFADDISHPTCDFVVAALVTASRHQTRDLGQLLTHLSECARAECHLYLRIWVSRARSRTAVRIITSVVATFITGLLVFDRAYLAPFYSVSGFLVVLAVVASFSVSLLWLAKIAEIRTPDRLFHPLEVM
jgi:tight adherence protein B